MGTSMTLLIGKEERTITLAFFYLIYLWKRFIDNTFFIFHGLTSSLKHWWHLWIKLDQQSNTTSPSPNKLYPAYMFRLTFLNPENIGQNFKKPLPTVWHYFTSTFTTHSALKRFHLLTNNSRQQECLQKSRPKRWTQQLSTHFVFSVIFTPPHYQ